MTTEAKQAKILAAINGRGWFTAAIYFNEARELRDAGLIKLVSRHFPGEGNKFVWGAA